VFQPKVDGYRCIASVVAGRVTLQSRSGGTMTAWFPDLLGLSAVSSDAILDGEVVCCDEDSRTRFEWMASWHGGRGLGQVKYCPFDLLRLDGVDLVGLPCIERLDRLRGRLATVTGWEPMITTGDGQGLWAATAAAGAEGVVAKRSAAVYRPGRSRSWLKAKHRSTAWFDVTGWRPTLPGRPGGLVLNDGEGIVGVAVLNLTAEDRQALVTLIGRYGRRHPTGTFTVPEAHCAPRRHSWPAAARRPSARLR
jgi:ATP-dependent DNA ligase